MGEDATAGEDPVLAELRRRLLGPRTRLGRREIARQAATSLPAARKFWHALGFPVGSEEQADFTTADLEALKRVTALIDEGGLDETLALAMTRAVARTADRLSVWQTQLLAESLIPVSDLENTHVPPEVAREVARRLSGIATDFEPLLTYAWRRHLYAALTRMISDADPQDAGLGPVRVVGFADLVNFTEVVRRASERELSALVQRFEQLASDIVTAHGGRVIKTVGDEVMFVATEPPAGTAIALDLLDGMAEEALLPRVRVGLAYGPVLSRMGDVFGTTVNRAARLSATAPASGVLVDEALAGRLAALSGFIVTPQRRRYLRGIGDVTPAAVTRSRGDRGIGTVLGHG